MNHTVAYSVSSVSISSKKQQASQWITSLFIMMTFYSYGTAMMDYFLLYPTRGMVGASEFPAYHTMLAELILPVSVFPFLALTVFNILMLWFRPVFIPKRLVMLSLICLILDWISTIFVQIPLNIQLNEKKDIETIEYIMQTNWLRVFLESAQAVIAFITMYLSLKKQKAKG